MSIEGVVLEEVARRVMDDGLELVNKGNLSEYEKGQLFAYFNIPSRSGFATPSETFKYASNLQNVSNGVSNPVTLRRNRRLHCP